MKKIISVFLCAILVMSAFCFVAAAKGGESSKTEIAFLEMSGNPGGEVFAVLGTYGNTDITDYVFTLNFNKSVLEYEGFNKGFLRDNTVFDHSDEGRITLVSLNGNSEPKDGALIVFKFKIAKKAKAGNYKLRLTKTSFKDSKGNIVKPTVKSGKVKVSKPCADGHKFSKWNSALASTCTMAGIDIRVCEKCGCTESKSVEPKGHKLEKTFTIDVESKGSYPGILSRHCTECGAFTNIVVYSADNTAGLNINSMVGKISDTSLENLIYFINGSVTYPDITDKELDVVAIVKNTDNPVNEDGSINAASAIDHILRKVFGDDKNSGIAGTVKRAVLAEELPIKPLCKLIKCVFGW